MEKLFIFIQSYFASREDEDRGATMVEYGILVAVIAVTVMAAAIVLGDAIADLFNTVAGAI
jgi:pilus assembly protein Flp/PilA